MLELEEVLGYGDLNGFLIIIVVFDIVRIFGSNVCLFICILFLLYIIIG